MLDPDLDLEADLGIDTVKQAEMFAAIRERYGIERDDSLKLRDYPTLATSSASSMTARRARRTAAPDARRARRPTGRAGAEPCGRAPRPAAPVARRRGRRRVLAIVAEQTGYPPDMLDPDLDLEADLGIDTVKQAECSPPSASATASTRRHPQAARLPHPRHVVGFVHDRTPPRPQPEPRRPKRRRAGARRRRRRRERDAFPRRVPVAGAAPAARPRASRPA